MYNMRKYLLHVLIISFVFAFQVSAYDKTDLKKAKATRDCSDCDLTSADLSDADLSDANLIGAYLSYANLIGANLSRADLYYANLSNAKLSDADLRRASLSGAKLRGAKLRGANLSDAYLRRANLSRADLSEVFGLNIEQLSKVKTLYKAKLDPELKTATIRLPTKFPINERFQ